MSINDCFVSPSNEPHLMKRCLKLIKNWASCLLLLEADNILATFCVNVPFRFSFTCSDCAKAKPLSLGAHFEMS